MSALLLAVLLTAAEKPVINVMYFDNYTTDPAYDVMRKGLADMIITDLIAWDGVTVVERERLESVLAELKLQQSKAFDAATVVKVGKLLGASYSLIGSMNLDQSKHLLRIDARLRDVKTGAFVVEARAEAAPDALFDLEQQLVEKLVNGLDSKLVANAAARRKARVPNLEAVQLYSQALDLSDQGKLEEAQAAMRQVVSKAPSFLLARERQQALLARFQDYEKRKHDLVTDSVLELAKRIDEGLKQAPSLDTMTADDVSHLLTLRVLKGRFIVRAAKQLFSAPGGYQRVARRGSEGKALLAQRAWLDNQRTLGDELARAKARLKGFYPSARLVGDEQKLLTDSQLGQVSFGDPFEDLLRFVMNGQANDGDSCALLPALGWVDAKERAGVLTELDARLTSAIARGKQDPRAPYDAFSAAKQRATLAVDDGDVDLAVSTMQRVLDDFPTASQAADFERDIKKLLEGHVGDERAARWGKGLKGCDTMDLLVGFSAADTQWLTRAGLKGVDEQLAAMDKACPKLHDSTVFHDFARLYVAHDDCDGAERLWRRYLAAGGSVRNLGKGTTVCPTTRVLTDVPWFHSVLDENWDQEFTEGLTSKLTGDQLVLTGTGYIGTPDGKARQALTLTLRRTADGWTCTRAKYLHYTGRENEGECTVKLTSLATKAGEFDEGTFSAVIAQPQERFKKQLPMTEGTFKLRRQ